MRALARAITGMELPAVEKISESQQEDPFQILIATLLSARTQDATTHAASTRLFARARTPRTMARLPVREIERLIYPVSFYRNKAEHVKACCEMLMSRFGGRVPATMEELMLLPGVGRKTANLVLILAFKSSRTSAWTRTCTASRTGWGGWRRRCPKRPSRRSTGRPQQRWWPYINLYLVTWGQNVCRPVYPRCGDCAIAADCPRIGCGQEDSDEADSVRVGGGG